MQDIEEMGSSEPPINLRDTLAPYVYRWPLFLLAALIALASAFIYLRYTVPVYEVNTLLLVKDEQKAGGNNEILNQLNLPGGSKVLANEIEIIKSKRIMQEVVKRLSLEVALQRAGRLITMDVYEDRPIIVQNIDIKPFYYGKTFNLSFPNKQTFLLKDPLSEEAFTGKIGEIQRSKLGSFLITNTVNFVSGQKETLKLTFLNPTIVANDYVSRLSVEPSSQLSTVLKLSLKTTVPDRGVDVLNTLILVYNEASLTDKNKTVKNSIDFINERLKLITVELTDVEKDIEGFKSTQGLTDIGGEASSFLEGVKTTDGQLNEVNLKLEVIKNIRQSLQQEFKKGKLPNTLGIEDPLLVQQIGQLYALELQKVNFLATLPASNPVFKPINEQAASLKSNIISSLNGLESTLKSMRNSFSAYNNRYESLIKRIPEQERKFLTIKRQQSIKENLYLFLLQKKEEAILSYASSAADTRVVEEATASYTPISPKRMMILGGAFGVAFLLVCLYVYAQELLNNKISSVKELKKLTPVPVLGEIVQQDDGELITENSRSAISEQLRSLRTNLQYVNRKIPGASGRTTLLTSSMSGEGKSFVACNLAVISALSGKKTVLLELDLRKPKITKYLKLKANVGITNYLIGKASIAEVLQPLSAYPNLTIIGSGPVPPNPSELLIGKEMEELMDYLKANYDEVIIDTPPIGLVTDAQILGKFAEVTLVLVRQNVTFKSQLSNITSLQASQKFPKMNLILNGIKRSGTYGYGYGYGYYSNEDTGKLGSLSTFFKDLKNRLF